MVWCGEAFVTDWRRGQMRLGDTRHAIDSTDCDEKKIRLPRYYVSHPVALHTTTTGTIGTQKLGIAHSVGQSNATHTNHVTVTGQVQQLVSTESSLKFVRRWSL